MQSLKQRLAPLLNGEVALSELDDHTSQALEIYCHFRGVQIAESLDPEKIKAELAMVPEPVRNLVTQSARRAYKRLRLGR